MPTGEGKHEVFSAETTKEGAGLLHLALRRSFILLQNPLTKGGKREILRRLGKRRTYRGGHLASKKEVFCGQRKNSARVLGKEHSSLRAVKRGSLKEKELLSVSSTSTAGRKDVFIQAPERGLDG